MVIAVVPVLALAAFSPLLTPAPDHHATHHRVAPLCSAGVLEPAPLAGAARYGLVSAPQVPSVQYVHARKLLAASFLRLCRVIEAIGRLVDRSERSRSSASFYKVVRLSTSISLLLENAASSLDAVARHGCTSLVFSDSAGTVPTARAELRAPEVREPETGATQLQVELPEVGVPVEPEQPAQWVSQSTVETVSRRREPVVDERRQQRQQRWDMYCAEPVRDAAVAEDSVAAFAKYAPPQALTHGFARFNVVVPADEKSEGPMPQLSHGFSTGAKRADAGRPGADAAASTSPGRSGSSMSLEEQSEWVEQWRRDRERRQQEKGGSARAAPSAQTATTAQSSRVPSKITHGFGGAPRPPAGPPTMITPPAWAEGTKSVRARVIQPQESEVLAGGKGKKAIRQQVPGFSM